ncbi:MAG: isocitrate lyase/PEP mutase family protein [Candidatus Baldrarchaeia archaeon]
MRLSPSARLRKLLEDREHNPLIVVGAHNALFAKLAEMAGFKAVYVSGACTSLERYGLPDIGLITATEMVENVRCITAATKLPVIADAETGYGNAINVMRTVREYIRAGVAALHIEDQVQPKRCGHLKGKMLISIEEMVGKIKAAKRVIKEEDDNIILVARTDARNAVGGGLEEVIKRLKAYVAAGADVVCSDVLLSKEEIRRVVKEVKAPVAYHPTGLSPRLSIEECKKLGVVSVVFPITPLQVEAVAVWNFYQELIKKGTQAQIEIEEKIKEHPLGTLVKLFEVGGLSKFLEYEKEYLPKEEVMLKYEKSFGLMPEEEKTEKNKNKY